MFSIVKVYSKTLSDITLVYKQFSIKQFFYSLFYRTVPFYQLRLTKTFTCKIVLVDVTESLSSSHLC